MLTPALGTLAAIVLFPTLYLLGMSMTHWVAFEPDVYFDGLENFNVAVSTPAFWDSTWVTVVYLVVSSLVMVVLGLLLALILTGNVPFKGLWRTLITLPFIIPPVVAGFTWKFLLNREIGFIGGYLLPMLGFEDSLLASPDWAIYSIVLADVWSRTAFMFLIYLAALQSIPSDLYEATRIDGASKLQEFWYITLPHILPAIVVSLLFRVVDAINTFDLIYVMTKGGPGTSTLMLSLYGWKTAFHGFDFGQAAAIALMMLVVTVVCSNILFKRFFSEKRK